jgi:hypothetical protein
MYKLRTSSYIVKPVDFEEFLRMIRSLHDCWFTVVMPNANLGGSAL